MSDILVPGVDGATGKIDPRVLPIETDPTYAYAASYLSDPVAGTRVRLPKLGATGKIDSAAIDASTLPGGAQQFTWHFPGNLLVRSGMAFMVTPQNAMAPNRRIHLLAFSAFLGTLPSPRTDSTANVSGALLVNRSVLQTFTLAYDMQEDPNATTVSALAGSTLNSGDIISVDITGVPTLPRDTQAGDLTITCWWEWVAAA